MRRENNKIMEEGIKKNGRKKLWRSRKMKRRRVSKTLFAV